MRVPLSEDWNFPRLDVSEASGLYLQSRWCLQKPNLVEEELLLSLGALKPLMEFGQSAFLHLETAKRLGAEDEGGANA